MHSPVCRHLVQRTIVFDLRVVSSSRRSGTSGTLARVLLPGMAPSTHVYAHDYPPNVDWLLCRGHGGQLGFV